MRLDFLADPTLAERYLIVDADAGEPIEHIAWADPETGTYAVVKQRPKTFRDRPNADLTVTRDGAPVLVERVGAIEVIDKTISPFKAELLALLDDPDVAAKVREIVAGG